MPHSVCLCRTRPPHQAAAAPGRRQLASSPTLPPPPVPAQAKAAKRLRDFQVKYSDILARRRHQVSLRGTSAAHAAGCVRAGTLPPPSCTAHVPLPPLNGFRGTAACVHPATCVRSHLRTLQLSLPSAGLPAHLPRRPPSRRSSASSAPASARAAAIQLFCPAVTAAHQPAFPPCPSPQLERLISISKGSRASLFAPGGNSILGHVQRQVRRGRSHGGAGRGWRAWRGGADGDGGGGGAAAAAGGGCWLSPGSVAATCGLGRLLHVQYRVVLFLLLYISPLENLSSVPTSPVLPCRAR